MIAQGFFEACTYSFESPKQMDKLLVPATHPLRRSIQIKNPLGEDYSMMRTSLALKPARGGIDQLESLDRPGGRL